MIDFAVEKFADVIDEIKPLLYAHWEEIARHKDLIKFDPDYARYRAMDLMDMLHIVTARSNRVLIGYAVSFITPHLHYKSCLMSLNDIVYLSPEYRQGSNAIRLFRYIENTLRQRGVMKAHITMKLAHDFGPVLEHIGYTEIERTYEKLLTKEGEPWE